MHVTNKPIGFWSAVSMGIGAMVGAGIFALLGEASVIAGSAVYLSFIIGGVIALVSAYSLGKLGAAFPSSGGMIEYLVQGFGVGYFTGTISIMLYLSALVSISVVAEAFANYAVTLLPTDSSARWHPLLSTGIIAVFVLVNLQGAKDVAFWERLTVAIKFVVLCCLAIAGLWNLQPALLSPASYPAPRFVLFSLAITFFAFEGFRIITNAAEDMPEPARTLPRAMMTAVIMVTLLYVAICFCVFGNLPVEQVITARDFALAQSARPVFGDAGFVVVTLTAIIATASAINASLYATTNVTYQLAKDGELPQAFGTPIAHSTEGLLISGLLIVVMSLLFDLTEVAAIGSVSILFVHGITHVGHLKLLKKTGASPPLVLLAILLCFLAGLLSLVYLYERSARVMLFLLLFPVVALTIEVLLRRVRNRTIRPRMSSSAGDGMINTMR